MKLSEYMKLVGKTDSEIGEMVNRNRTTVMRWRLGKTRPDWDALARLNAISGGAVQANDFFPQEPAQ